MSWTPINLEIAKRLWTEGKSASEIMCALRTPEEPNWPSRNAVIGKLHRAGLTCADGGSEPASGGWHKSHVAVASKPRAIRAGPRSKPAPQPTPIFINLGRLHEGAPAAPLPPLREIAPTVEPRHWLTRKFGECAWVIGEGGADALSCCAPVAPGKSWCPAHMRLGTTVGRGAWASTTELIRSVRRFA